MRYLIATLLCAIMVAPVGAPTIGSALEAAKQDPRMAIVNRFMRLDPKKTALLDFKGDGTRYLVVSGQFKRGLTGRGARYRIHDFFSPAEDHIEKGEYGLAIVPADEDESVMFSTVSTVGELKFFEPYIQGTLKDDPDCWSRRARKDALFVGVEDAGGVIFYSGGWRWRQCGD